MTDWELRLNNRIESVKNNPEEIKNLVKEYIREIGESSIKRFYELPYSKIKNNIHSVFADVIESELMERDIKDYNADLFNQY